MFKVINSIVNCPHETVKARPLSMVRCCSGVMTIYDASRSGGMATPSVPWGSLWLHVNAFIGDSFDSDAFDECA
jgi:hypothetical protein